MRPLLRLAPLLLSLSACVPVHPSPGGASPIGADEQPPHLDQGEIHADLIQRMLDNGQYYAALAHIQEQQRIGHSDELTLLEAEARAHLGQTAQAEALYRTLLDDRLYAAQAYHGLGRLYVATDLDSAIGNLRSAVERAPTDVKFRNDLGYALMEAGRYTEANMQLSTAAELAPTQRQSRNNLIILMMLLGNEGAVRQLAQESAATPQSLQELRSTAQSIRDKQKARAAKATG